MCESPLLLSPVLAASSVCVSGCQEWLQLPWTQTSPLSHNVQRFSDEPPSTSEPTSHAEGEPGAAAMTGAEDPLEGVSYFL